MSTSSKKLVDSVNSRSLAVVKEGIYYTRWRQKDRRNELCLLDPSTLENRVLSVLDGNLAQGLTVSPDGKTILYARARDSNSDLMLIENFR